jgi:hypothetical protein
VSPALLSFVAVNGGVRINGELCQPQQALSMGRTRFVTPRGTTVVLDSASLNEAITRRANSGWWTRDQQWRRP